MPRPKKPVGTHVFQKDQKELSDCNAVRQLFLYVISSIIMLLQVPSRVMRKFVCKLWLNEVSQQ